MRRAGTCLPRELQAPRASHRGHIHGEEDGHEAAGGSIQQRLHACMAHGSRITDHRSIRLAPRPHMAVMCSSVWPLCIRGWPGAHREGVTDDVVLERLQQRQAKACYALVRVAAARQVHAPQHNARVSTRRRRLARQQLRCQARASPCLPRTCAQTARERLSTSCFPKTRQPLLTAWCRAAAWEALPFVVPG